MKSDNTFGIKAKIDDKNPDPLDESKESSYTPVRETKIFGYLKILTR